MLNSLMNSFAGLNNLWGKLESIALKIVGLAGVLGGASRLLLEVAKAIQDKSAPEFMALVKTVMTGQDPAVIAIGLGLGAMGLHTHLANITNAANMPVPALADTEQAQSLAQAENLEPEKAPEKVVLPVAEKPKA